MIEEYDTIDTVVNNVVQKLDRGNQIQMSPEDAKHEGWLVALEVLAKGKEHENLEAYLYIRIRGAILNSDKSEWRLGMTGIGHTRLEQDQYEGTEDDDIDFMDEDYLGLYGVEEKTPLDFAEEAEMMELADKLLTSQQKDIVQLIYFKDLTYREIASLTGIPRQTVSRIHDEALTEMRQVMLITK